jgi:serpin B
MLTWLNRRLRNSWSGLPRRRPKCCRPKARPLSFEPLESRELLTVSSFVGPLPFRPTAGGAHAVAPPANTAQNPAAPPLSSAQIASETTAGQSINAFGLDLYKDLQAAAGGSGNMFLSPFSVSTALAMAYAGTRGDTASQMASVLHLSGDPATVAQDFGTLLTDLNSAGQSNYALSVADALWGQQGLQFLSQFLNTLQTDYGGGLNQVDFKDQAEAVRQTINTWVAQHTNDKIQNLFPPGSIDSATQFVLANAIYFKGNWATAFNAASTYDANFSLASGTNEQVPTMHSNNTDYAYMQSDGLQVLQLPYAGGRLAMDVLLPTATGAAGLSVSQLPTDLNGWLAGLTTQPVDVSLPKFTLTTQFDLGKTLQQLGMTSAFSNGADFSGITDSAPLKISDVVHKAYIGVDETGTEAAGATGVVGIEATIVGAQPPPPVIFNADHPFLFMIRDTQSGSVLFMGQEADPLSNGGDSNAPGISAHATPQPQPPSVQPPISIIGPLGPLGPPAPVHPVLPVGPIRFVTLPVDPPVMLPFMPVPLISSSVGTPDQTTGASSSNTSPDSISGQLLSTVDENLLNVLATAPRH